MPVSSPSLAWGVVGTGDISRAISADLALLDSARLYAVCSRAAATAKSFASDHGFERSFGDLDEMLSDHDLDIVYVGTPHATHRPIALKALAAGKHVLIEKPIGVSASEARTIADAARRAGRFAMEAMWTRFAPAYQALLRQVRAGSIGEVRSVQASFGLPFGAAGSSRWSAEKGSSTLLDQGIYPVTLALDILGHPESLSSRAIRREDGVDLTMRTTFDYEGEKFADLVASMVEYIDPRASINGTTGWITVPAPFWVTTRFTTHSGDIEQAFRSPDQTSYEAEGIGYVPMLRAVTEAIADGYTEHPLHSLDASIETFTVLDQIRAGFTSANPPHLRNHL